MKGKHQGVQKKVLDLNLRSFYISCGCYSLKLVLCDMTNSCFKVDLNNIKYLKIFFIFYLVLKN